jgi:acyl dehydratase
MFDSSKIGHSFPPFTVDIERSKIREMALAIGDYNPVYQSREAAQAAGYPDVPVLPTMGSMFMFWGNAHFVEQLAELGLNVARVIHLEETYEYLAPLHAGESVTGVMTVLDGTTRKGPQNSSIDLVTLQFRYTNQRDQPVLIATSRFVVRE